MSEKKMEKVEVVEEQKDGFLTRMRKNIWSNLLKIGAGAAVGTVGTSIYYSRQGQPSYTPTSVTEQE